ncbi:hypothetical protein [Streptomyces sp. NPDC048252]|uniref:hypothetical protein n=1 Tax=Streptomyces sp. NPDC048252 TaxID=3154612 RepID=UPI003419AF22
MTEHSPRPIDVHHDECMARAEAERAAANPAEPHRLALSEALGLGTGAPWDAIRERAAELAAAAVRVPATERAAVRCSSCEHEAQYHDADGRCWFTVEQGVPERDAVCSCLLRRLAAEPAADTPDQTQGGHVCKPEAKTYFCPTSGQTESDCHGGFDQCCDRPEFHQPAVGGAQQPKEADRVVAYRSAIPGAWSIYCTHHTDELGDGATPLTSDDLTDGGLCVDCGVDVLIEQQPKEA